MAATKSKTGPEPDAPEEPEPEEPTEARKAFLAGEMTWSEYCEAENG